MIKDIGWMLGVGVFVVLTAAVFADDRADAKEMLALVEAGVHPVYANCMVEGCSQVNWEAAKRIVDER